MNKVFLVGLIITLVTIIYLGVTQNRITESFNNTSNRRCENINDFKMKKNMRQIDKLQDKLDSFNRDLDKTKLKVNKNYEKFKKSMKGAKTSTNQLNNF